MDTDYKHSETTEKIIGAAYAVYNTLGFGFVEKVYENALALELKGRGLRVVQQQPIPVLYRGQVVGDYAADLVVDDRVIVEIKAVSGLSKVHEVQLVNYLKATEIEVGLLMNFGTELEFKRRIFDQ
jgi:GxxExxY protein